MKRRHHLRLTGAAAATSFLPFTIPGASGSSTTLDLAEIREIISTHFEEILDQQGRYGAYRIGVGERTDLYSSVDVAISRHIMGERLPQSLNEESRNDWIYHINSFQQRKDGSYTDTFNHAPLHANGMVIGALGVLGGKQKYPVKLYDQFNTVEKVDLWLENIDCSQQWSGSHIFWGGIHCYSLSKECSQEWLDFVFEWLDDNLDEQTGWWRKGTAHSDRNQPLGGSVHIIPIYQHHNRVFPYPERVIDSVLALQVVNGRWLDYERDQTHVMHYLELDALYALNYMMELAPNYRINEIMKAVNNYGDLVVSYWNSRQNELLALHPHRILAAVGTFGLLQTLLPDRFQDQTNWTDIFGDIALYNTSEVEA
jgi:hypothetical protein